MGRSKKRYVCQACGGVSYRWQGQCADCAEWNSLVEEVPATVFSPKHDLSGGGRLVAFVALDAAGRGASGGARPGWPSSTARSAAGWCPGSAVLMGGDPGSASRPCCSRRRRRWRGAGASAVYVSGEEAAGQVRLRARRLGLADAPIRLAAATSVRDILTTLGARTPPACW